MAYKWSSKDSHAARMCVAKIHADDEYIVTAIDGAIVRTYVPRLWVIDAFNDWHRVFMDDFGDVWEA